MAATTTTASYVRERIANIPCRAAALAAQEFLADEDWRTLPQRIATLCEKLRTGNWVSVLEKTT